MMRFTLAGGWGSGTATPAGGAAARRSADPGSSGERSFQKDRGRGRAQEGGGVWGTNSLVNFGSKKSVKKKAETLPLWRGSHSVGATTPPHPLLGVQPSWSNQRWGGGVSGVGSLHTAQNAGKRKVLGGLGLARWRGQSDGE